MKTFGFWALLSFICLFGFYVVEKCTVLVWLVVFDLLCAEVAAALLAGLLLLLRAYNLLKFVKRLLCIINFLSALRHLLPVVLALRLDVTIRRVAVIVHDHPELLKGLLGRNRHPLLFSFSLSEIELLVAVGIIELSKVSVRCPWPCYLPVREQLLKYIKFNLLFQGKDDIFDPFVFRQRRAGIVQATRITGFRRYKFHFFFDRTLGLSPC